MFLKKNHHQDIKNSRIFSSYYDSAMSNAKSKYTVELKQCADIPQGNKSTGDNEAITRQQKCDPLLNCWTIYNRLLQNRAKLNCGKWCGTNLSSHLLTGQEMTK